MSNVGLKLAIAAVVLLFANQIGGIVEGRFLPVAVNFEVDRIEPAPHGSSRIWGRFDLVRPGCRFDGIEWVLEGNVRPVVASVVFERGTRERAGGAQEFGPWLVQLTPEQLTHTSRAIVYHSCPWRPWLTVSHLFP